MTDLDTLRPEVRMALEVCDRDLPETWHSQTTQWAVIRAELLRLAEIEKERWSVVATRNAAIERTEKAEAELAESRETIKRLNRRVQVAEAGVAEKVKASAPGSLGRALANAAASKAEAELAALKARIADGWLCGVSNDACPGNFDAAIYCIPSRFRGKRVRLLVEE